MKYLKVIFAISLLTSPIVPLTSFFQIEKYALRDYVIEFNTNGGQPIEDLNLKYNQQINLPTPTKTGHRFLNWSTEALVNDAFSIDTMPAENLTLYAKWTVNTYTIQFVTNGGSGINAITANYGTALSFPVTTRTGYSFAGWHRDVDLTQIYSVPSTMPAETATIYAKWSLNNYMITLNTNGGNSLNPIQAAYGSIITVPDPVKMGNTFNGWYRDSGLSQRYLVPDTMPAENLTLYAKWTVNTYTIQFVTNGGSGINAITANYGTALSFPVTTRTGYSFAGWHRDVDLTQIYSVPSTMPAETATIYAKWSLNNYMITLNTNGGNSLNPIQAAYGSIITVPDPVKMGNTFNGWYRDSGLSQRYLVPDTMPAENLTLYAKWKDYTVNFNIGINTGSLTLSSDKSYIWGTNIWGGLGSGNLIDVLQPTETFNLYADDEIKKFELDDRTSGALTFNGRLFLWGSPFSGSTIIIANDNDEYKPLEVTNRFDLESDDKLIDFSLTESNGTAITTKGKIFTWGYEAYGRLGNGRSGQRYTDLSAEPINILQHFQLNNPEKIITIDWGGGTAAALTNLGKLFSWGSNSRGQIGNGTFSDQTTPTLLNNRMGLINNETITDFSMGGEHSGAITSNGRLFMWGQNGWGQAI